MMMDHDDDDYDYDNDDNDHDDIRDNEDDDTDVDEIYNGMHNAKNLIHSFIHSENFNSAR